MAGETVINIIGNLVDDPELRFVPTGAAVAKFKVASTPRVFDRQSNAWKDGESLFLTCSVWRDQAENVASTLAKGMRVIVQGRLKQRSYEDREGVKRTVFEVEVEEVGPSLLRATARVEKAGGSGQGREAFVQARREQGQAPAEDPWTPVPGTRAPAAGGGGWGAQAEDDPPF